MFARIITAFFGPRLYRYLIEQPERRYLQYEPIYVESWANSFIGFADTFFSFSRHAWFIVVPYMYVRGYFTREGVIYMAYFAGIVFLLYFLSFTARGLDRLANPVYSDFLRVYLKEYPSHKDRKIALAKFSYDFQKWESDFDMRDLSRKSVLNEFKPTFNLKSLLGEQSLFTKFLKAPQDFVCYCLMNVIGRRMIYPGSMQFLNALVAEPREEARAKFQSKELTAERLKITTSLGESVDAFIVDKRNSEKDNGNKIVICTEGNGGFYEVGIMATPLEAGFSVIGWNHPGFGGSTGDPYPKNEHAAIDAVYKYVRTEKGFKDDDIILFGWSIGGYATGWLAMNYPNIHAVMVDASFDDLVPLAVSKMPAFANSLVTQGIRQLMDLRVAEQLASYSGAILFYRRTKDEIITTEMRNLATNRVNDLVLHTVRHRYPQLFMVDGEPSGYLEEHAKAYFSVPLAFHEPIMNFADIRRQIEETRANELEDGIVFPSQIGEGKTVEEKEVYIEFMIQAYMIDLEDVHCTPLPTSFFQVPKQL